MEPQDTPFLYTQEGRLNHDFRTCLYHLNEYGLVANPRGTTTKELLNYNITLNDPRNRVIMFDARKTKLQYLLGEFIWYLSGSNDPKGIVPYAKFWEGITNSGDMPGYAKGTVNSNYGHRLFGHDNTVSVPYVERVKTPGGCDEEGNLVIEPGEMDAVFGQSQWNAVVDLLKKDKDSRQAIVNIHMPSDRHAGNKDVCCTLTLQFLIREDRLCMIVNMRSNDIILGFTNDVFQFTMLQEALMLQLREAYPNLQLGIYYHNAGSMHVYDRHFKMMDEIIADQKAVDVSMVPMDEFTDRTMLGLYTMENLWQRDGANPDWDPTQHTAWTLLSPYWQDLFRMCFLNDEEAFKRTFGDTD